MDTNKVRSDETITGAPLSIRASFLQPVAETLPPRTTRCSRRSPSAQRSPIAHRSRRIVKLTEQDHFHYNYVELGAVVVTLVSMNRGSPQKQMLLEVESNGRKWRISRNFVQLCEFDCQLHRCVFDRSHSRLQELSELDAFDEDLMEVVENYLSRLSQITGSLIRCFPVLRFLEVDCRGNRFLPAEETPINTPAIATAIVTKDYEAQSCEQISLKVGDIVSIIEKAQPSENERTWWKAKLTIIKDSEGNEVGAQQFQVGIFPSDCVKIFDGKSELRNGSVSRNERCSPRQRSLVRSLLKRNAVRHIPVFGTDLVEYLQKTGDEVPLILEKCVQMIEVHGIVTGVYRQCGIQSNIQRLRNGFDSGNVPDLNDETILRDVHCVSSLLKQYFRQLPNPLFTFELYPDFIVAYETLDETRASKFKNVIDRLPKEHYRTARYLVHHLAKLCHCTHLTDMNSKNLAIVWAPNLFRCPPCQNGNDSYLLQGLNAQTGLCNYILVHAVYLFSLDKDSLSLPVGCNASPSIVRKYEQTASPDLSSRSCIDVNGGPSSLPAFHTVLERPSRKLSAQSRTWRRLLRGPSVDNALASLRSRWKRCGEKYVDADTASNSVKWRRSPSTENLTHFRATRSASLMSFVTKSVEEFRNGLIRSWRTRTANSRHMKDCNFTKDQVQLRHSEGTTARKLKREGVVSSVEFCQFPSTSADTRLTLSYRRSISRTNSSLPVEAEDNSSRRDGLEDCMSSFSSDSRHAFVPLDDVPQPTDEQETSRCERRVAFSTSSQGKSFEELNKRLARSSTLSSCHSSQSSESLQLDMSRYDNVSPLLGTSSANNASHFAGTPLSFYDVPQSAPKANRSNVQLYFL